MQTFLPVPSFQESARILDYRRLGKQRVEARQILKVLARGSGPWSNHPAVLMWRGYEQSLELYASTMILEWISRGYKNTMSLGVHQTDPKMPSWIGDDRFHASHRSNLLRKFPEFYSQYRWTESSDLQYVWPVKQEKK